VNLINSNSIASGVTNSVLAS